MPAKIQAALPSLADPARALCLQGADRRNAPSALCTISASSRRRLCEAWLKSWCLPALMLDSRSCSWRGSPRWRKTGQRRWQPTAASVSSSCRQRLQGRGSGCLGRAPRAWGRRRRRACSSAISGITLYPRKARCRADRPMARCRRNISSSSAATHACTRSSDANVFICLGAAGDAGWLFGGGTGAARRSFQPYRRRRIAAPRSMRSSPTSPGARISRCRY